MEESKFKANPYSLLFSPQILEKSLKYPYQSTMGLSKEEKELVESIADRILELEKRKRLNG